MTMTTRPELDSFENALLGELRSAVGARTAPPVRRHRLPIAAAAVLAGAIAITGGTTLLRPDAAFAVTEQSDGDIVITLHRLDDTEGLERALASHGITADVNYDAPDQQALPAPTGEPLRVVPDDVTTNPDGSQSLTTDQQGTVTAPGDVPADWGQECGFGSNPLTTEIKGSDYVITIPEGSVLREPGNTLEITSSGNLDDKWAGLMVNYTADGLPCGIGTVEASAVPAG